MVSTPLASEPQCSRPLLQNCFSRSSLSEAVMSMWRCSLISWKIHGFIRAPLQVSGGHISLNFSVWLEDPWLYQGTPASQWGSYFILFGLVASPWESYFFKLFSLVAWKFEVVTCRPSSYLSMHLIRLYQHHNCEQPWHGPPDVLCCL